MKFPANEKRVPHVLIRILYHSAHFPKMFRK